LRLFEWLNKDIMPKKEAIRVIESKRARDYDIFTLLSNGIGSEAAASIWMAIELGFNIIVTGDAEGIEIFLQALPSLMQPYHKGLVIESGHNEDWLIANPNLVCTENLDSKTTADLIIVEHSNLANVTNAFLNVFNGSSFVIALPGKVIEGIVNTLTSKPYEVDGPLIQLLDIVIQIDKHGMVEDMAEFRWHSRAERGCPADQPCGSLRLIRDSTVDYNAFKESKLIRRYAQKNLIGLQESLEEMKRRSAFLASLKKGDVEPWEITRQFLLYSCRATPQKLK